MTTCDNCGRMIALDDCFEREMDDGNDYVCGECWTYIQEDDDDN